LLGARRPTVSNNSNSKNSSSSSSNSNNNTNNNNNNNNNIIIIIIIILMVTDKYYEHIPESVTTVNDTTIMWAVPVSTDRTILANRPDIVLRDKKEKTSLIIDIAISDD
jgi:hypothetical protein